MNYIKAHKWLTFFVICIMAALIWSSLAPQAAGPIFLMGLFLPSAMWLIHWSIVDAQRTYRKQKEIKAYFDHVMAHGTFEEKQLAMMYMHNKQLEQLKALVGLDILLHL